jgi:hypothetical protein
VSGTLRLPLASAFPTLETTDPAATLLGARATLRDLRYHPERYLEPHASQPESVQELIAAKRRWIETHPTVTLARRRCQEIRAINERLTAQLEGKRLAAEADMTRCSAAAKARTVLRSREVPWCFFPENEVKSFLLLENGVGPA